MSTNSQHNTNGWSEYKLVILRRLDDLEKSGAERDAAAEERHQCLLKKVSEIQTYITEEKANRTLQWFKVAGLSFVISYATAYGVAQIIDLIKAIFF